MSPRFIFNASINLTNTRTFLSFLFLLYISLVFDGAALKIMVRLGSSGLVLCMLLSVSHAIPDEAERIANFKTRLEKILIENILPFWYPKTMDVEYGGFLINHDENGTYKGPSDKYLVTQAREVGI